MKKVSMFLLIFLPSFVSACGGGNIYGISPQNYKIIGYVFTAIWLLAIVFIIRLNKKNIVKISLILLLIILFIIGYIIFYFPSMMLKC
jgi:hypothetical protein